MEQRRIVSVKLKSYNTGTWARHTNDWQVACVVADVYLCLRIEFIVFLPFMILLACFGVVLLSNLMT